PGGTARRARQQAHQGERRHRFPAAGLADETQRLPALDAKGDVAHRMQRAARRRNVDVEARAAEQRAHAQAPSPTAVTPRTPSPPTLRAGTSKASAVPGMAMSQNEKNM